MEEKILIVGYGITGKNLHKEISVLNPDVTDITFTDKYLGEKKHESYDLIFVCVDTPYVNEKNPCDVSAIKNVICEWRDKLDNGGVFVIKSTILPHTAFMLEYMYNVRVVVSPEYYGNTVHCNNFNFDFTILGGEKYDCIKVQQALQKCHDARHSFRITNHVTAELVKYMENSYLATIVSLCSQFYNIANRCGVAYEELRELFVLDPRVNPSHTFIDRDAPYWDSHCLNKDVRAIALNCDAELLKAIIEFNEKQKK